MNIKIPKFENLPRRVIRVAIVVFIGTITALACAWSAFNDHSVRFNDERTGRAFYRLPPLPIMYDIERKRDVSEKEVENYYPDNEPKIVSSPPIPKPDDLWEQAKAAVLNENLTLARDLLKQYLDLTAVPAFDEDEHRQQRRNSANDLLDAMSAIKHGSKVKAVIQYAKARYAFDDEENETMAELRSEALVDPELLDNWDYLEAARLYRDKSPEALAAFQKHADKYPHSEKNEAVLYMLAKLKTESSYAFSDSKCGVIDMDHDNQDDEITEPIKEICQDENWLSAIRSFEKLIQKYPNGRYFNDARGWIAFLYKRGGERAKALAEYYRLLGDPRDRSARLAAKKSLQMIGHEYDDETLDEVEKLIAGDVNAALAYSYHRIYNYAVDLTYDEPEPCCCYGKNQWQEKEDEKKRVSDENKTGDHELERVAKFATAMMKRYPEARLSGDFVLRTAEAQLELQNFLEALKLSEKALDLGLQGDMRMEGLWIKGSSEHKLNKLTSARTTFSHLISEFPKSKLTEGARRLLAMTAEDQGDLETALDLYLDLNYEQDIAYFIDVLLPTDRLAKFIDTRKNILQHNQLLYALGVRYMRDKRWNEARETLKQVQTEAGTDGYLESDKTATWYFPKETIFDTEEFSYIKTSWVMQDLKTIDIFEYYEHAVESAQGDDAKAEAMYQLASSLFEADDLSFYNPAVWKGGRTLSLNSLPFSDHERLPNETRIIFEHLQAHDPLARSIPIYEEIAARFPQTKTARDALYSAAVAHERLSGRYYSWQKFYERGLFAGPRIVTYDDVRRAYPHYQLPRGTVGWKPSTRTVNGGPGWDPPPKPLPKVSRTQKAGRAVKRFADESLTAIQTKLNAAKDEGSAIVSGSFYYLLAAVLLFAGGYGTLLFLYFPKSYSASKGQALLPESMLEQLPDSESRMSKVIDDD